MVKENKAKAVDEVADSLSRSKIAVLTDFRAVPASAMTQLRRQFRQAGVEYKVVKNTLTFFAAEKANKEAMRPMLEGPTAIAFGYKDEVTVSKVLADFMKTSGAALRIKGAVLGSRVLGPSEVAALTTLPSREQLVAMLTGRMKSPINGIVIMLGAPLRGLMGVLQARARQLEESAKPAAS
ncbi:MAG: 50S ribosomal protein L10 [Chloroflexi bacterium]|nr:50S ribosomal protein L10 [Chloroflexota bacterium]